MGHHQLLFGGSFNPKSISGLTAWYDFSNISTLWKDTARTSAVTADADIILGVTDLSGTANHLSEATNGPAYKTVIQNGHSVARFDGTNDRLFKDPLVATISQPLTYFLVFKLNAAYVAPGASILDGHGGRVQMVGNSAGDNKWAVFAGGTPRSSSVTYDTSSHIIQLTTNAASTTMRIGGGADTLSGLSPGTNGLDAVVLATDSIAGGSGFVSMDYDEVLVYNSALSVANMNAVGNYLAAKWGLTWTTAT